MKKEEKEKNLVEKNMVVVSMVEWPLPCIIVCFVKITKTPKISWIT